MARDSEKVRVGVRKSKNEREERVIVRDRARGAVDSHR